LKRVATWALILGALILTSGVPVAPPATITIDYPSDGSLYPPEFPPPTFLWRDADPEASLWVIDIVLGDSSRNLQVRSSGERMRIGEIDPRCVTPTNAPTLTPEQGSDADLDTGRTDLDPDQRQSVKDFATVTITGFRDKSAGQAIRAARSGSGSRGPGKGPIFLPGCAAHAHRG